MTHATIVRMIKGPASSSACQGAHLAMIIAEIGLERPDLNWYVADVQVIGQPFVPCDQDPRLVGGSAELARLAGDVIQFESGVFAGVPHNVRSPTFRTGGLWTEDPDSADLGDALVEIRAFDTSYIVVITSDEAIARCAERCDAAWVDEADPRPG